jgi:thiamine biosynthesis lipoprotein
MGRLAIVWLLCVSVAPAMSTETTQTRFEFRQTEMAIPIRIVIYSTENATAAKAAEAAFSRFQQLNAILSDYDPQSELRRLCDTAGGGHSVPVSNDLWRVLVAAEQLSERSHGAFDVSVGPLVHCWRNARRTKELPSPEMIQKALKRVGYQSIRLDPKRQAVELLKPNMRLDLGGIAKGYAVDEAMAVLRKHGITRMLIDAGGNIGLGNPPPEQVGWRIGISPPDAHHPPREYLYLSNCALSTSGDLWQYAIIHGTRYSHIIDAHTGMALTDHSSVTVVGPDGLHTDGLSSAVAILGPEKGLELVEKTPEVAAFIVQMVDGKERTYESKRWKKLRGMMNDE